MPIFKVKKIFRDQYTGEVYQKGELELTQERAQEIFNKLGAGYIEAKDAKHALDKPKKKKAPEKKAPEQQPEEE